MLPTSKSGLQVGKPHTHPDFKPRILTPSFNFLVQHNWSSFWVLCMAVRILTIIVGKKMAYHILQFWLQTRRESWDPASANWHQKPGSSPDIPSPLMILMTSGESSEVACMRSEDTSQICYETPAPWEAMALNECEMDLDQNPWCTIPHSTGSISLRLIGGKLQNLPKQLQASTKALKKLALCKATPLLVMTKQRLKI